MGITIIIIGSVYWVFTHGLPGIYCMLTLIFKQLWKVVILAWLRRALLFSCKQRLLCVLNQTDLPSSPGSVLSLWLLFSLQASLLAQQTMMTSAFWRECDWRCDCGDTRWNWYFIDKTMPVRSCSHPQYFPVVTYWDLWPSASAPRVATSLLIGERIALPVSILQLGLEFNWLPEHSGCLSAVTGLHAWWAISTPAFSSIFLFLCLWALYYLKF